MNLVSQRCFNHAGREAAARCPACSQFYCRECISEHSGKLLCASCLKSQAESAREKPRRFSSLIHTAELLCALFLTWLFFYFCGLALLSIPTSFHDASALQSGWFNSP